MTLSYLAEFDDVAALMDDAHRRTPVVYETVIARGETGAVAIWAGDAGYATEDPAVPGARHRLVMGPVWVLEHTG
jgi:hypothetical protein